MPDRTIVDDWVLTALLEASQHLLQTPPTCSGPTPDAFACAHYEAVLARFAALSTHDAKDCPDEARRALEEGRAIRAESGTRPA